MRLSKFSPPAPPAAISEVHSSAPPTEIKASSLMATQTSQYQPLSKLQPKTQVSALSTGALRVSSAAQSWYQTARSKIRAWLALFLATWLGPLAALLGAPSIFNFDLVLSLLLKWTRDNRDNILDAQNHQISGRRGEIDWRCSFFAFMESTGMYLRDLQLHYQAWEQYRNSHTAADQEDAINTYLAAHEKIEKLAEAWGMKFYPVDMLHVSPNGHPEWDGPFCGILYTTEKQEANPFIGIAFKGTGPLELNQWRVDFDYQLTAAEAKYFNDDPSVKISEGVYSSLFGDGQGGRPYETILNKARELTANLPNTSGRPVPVHVTGHSLGGSYATLCYTQLLIDVAPSSPGPHDMVMGDAYTFGAPRVGSRGWAAFNSKLVHLPGHLGQFWRIVNHIDLVPQVPPTSLQPKELDFCHVDQGVHIWPHSLPQSLPNEQDQPSPKPYPITSILYLIPTLLRAMDHREYNMNRY